MLYLEHQNLNGVKKDLCKSKFQLLMCVYKYIKINWSLLMIPILHIVKNLCITKIYKNRKLSIINCSFSKS